MIFIYIFRTYVLKKEAVDMTGIYSFQLTTLIVTMFCIYYLDKFIQKKLPFILGKSFNKKSM